MMGSDIDEYYSQQHTAFPDDPDGHSNFVDDNVFPNYTSSMSTSTPPSIEEFYKTISLLQAYSRNYSGPHHDNVSETECDGTMLEMGARYKRVHGYLAVVVCLFGVIANILIMVVLTRKEMRTPINLMLFALAMADLLIMIEYIPFALHMYVIDSPPEVKFSLNWARFVFFHNHFTQILHTISIQLTLSMAIWRYVAIKCSTQSTSFCTFQRCYQVIAAAYICPLFFCILNYFYFQIHGNATYKTALSPSLDRIDETDHKKMTDFLSICKVLNVHMPESGGKDYCEKHTVYTLYTVEMSEIAQEYPILHKMHFWTFSVIIKLIPCVVLTFFMCWLVNTLYKARKHHKMIERKSAVNALPTAPKTGEEPLLTTNNGSPKEKSSIQRKSGNRASINKSVSNEQASLLVLNTTENGKRPNGSISANNQLISSAHLIPEATDATISGVNSRRASRDSTGEIRDGVRRFSKGLIRFPSIRRPSTSRGSKSRRTDRTSKMLMAVLLLFLLTEFPQGIMHFLTGWYGPSFFKCYYNTWAEVWDMLALINSAVNFILYCFMSKQFRTQFRLSFNLVCFHKYKFMGSCNNNQNIVSATV